MAGDRTMKESNRRTFTRSVIAAIALTGTTVATAGGAWRPAGTIFPRRQVRIRTWCPAGLAPSNGVVSQVSRSRLWVAQHGLGLMHANGRGTARNLIVVSPITISPRAPPLRPPIRQSRQPGRAVGQCPLATGPSPNRKNVNDRHHASDRRIPAPGGPVQLRPGSLPTSYSSSSFSLWPAVSFCCICGGTAA